VNNGHTQPVPAAVVVLVAVAALAVVVVAATAAAALGPLPVIARSGSDEAIQSSRAALDCFARTNCFAIRQGSQ
jgi:hypothetical protein